MKTTDENETVTLPELVQAVEHLETELVLQKKKKKGGGHQ